jgi:hypothetical protein
MSKYAANAGEGMAKVSPLLVLQARAEARALLYRAGIFDLEEALAPLQAYARKRGIIDKIGSDATLAILKQAFKGVAEL